MTELERLKEIDKQIERDIYLYLLGKEELQKWRKETDRILEKYKAKQISFAHSSPLRAIRCAKEG